MDVKKLIESVIVDLADNKTLNDVANKVIIISKLLKNDEFSKWVKCEFIDGFSEKDNLPACRKIKAIDIKASYLGYMIKATDASVPIQNLGSTKYTEIMSVEIIDPIQQIVKHIDRAKETNSNLYYSLTANERYAVQQVLGGCQIINVYKVISCGSFEDIVTQTQAMLINLFLDFNELLFNNELEFDAKRECNVIQTIVNNYIDANNVNLGSGILNANDSNNVVGSENVIISKDSTNKILELIDKIDELSSDVEDDREDIAEAITSLRTEITSDSPRKGFVKGLFRSLLSIGGAAFQSAASAIIKEGIEEYLK